MRRASCPRASSPRSPPRRADREAPRRWPTQARSRAHTVRRADGRCRHERGQRNRCGRGREHRNRVTARQGPAHRRVDRHLHKHRSRPLHGHPRPARRARRPRLLAVQARHPAAPHRAPHARSRRGDDAGLSASAALEPAGSGVARQGVADRRDRLLPRPLGVATPGRARPAAAAGRARRDFAAARLGRRLLHRRGGVYAGDAAGAGARRRAAAQPIAFPRFASSRPM